MNFKQFSFFSLENGNGVGDDNAFNGTKAIYYRAVWHQAIREEIPFKFVNFYKNIKIVCVCVTSYTSQFELA